MDEPTDYDRQQDEAASERAEKQARRDAEQTSAIASQGRRITAIDEFIITPDEVAANPRAQEPSPAQRLRIHVPNVKTTLSMGAGAARGSIRQQDDTGAPNYCGFGVHTEGHVFVDAVGPESKMTLQAISDVTIQSQGGLSVGGKEGLLAGTQSAATVYGGGGVTIYGGQPAVWGAEPPGSDGQTQPEAPTWIDSMSSVGTAIGSSWAAIDAAWVIRDSLWKRVETKLGKAPWSAMSTGKFATIAGLVGGIASGMSSVAWAPGVKRWAGHWSWPFGGTTIHGTAGLIMGSSATATLYSLAGTAIATPAALDLFGGYVGMAAAKDMHVRAANGTLTLGAGTNVEVLATNKLELAARSGQARLYGSSVKIGKHSPEGTQDDTDAVTIDAARLVEVNAQRLSVNASYTEFNGTSGFTAGGAHVLLSAGTLHGTSFDKTMIHSQNALEVGVGKWMMKADQTSMTIGCANEPLPKIPVYEGKEPEFRNADGTAKWWKDGLSEIKAKMDATDSYNRDADRYNAKFANTCHLEMKSSKMVLNVGGYQAVLTSSKFKHGSALVIKK